MFRFFFGRLAPVQFGKALFARLKANAVTDRAAQLSYYFLFALFPSLFFVVTLAAYLPVQGSMDDLLARLDSIMPADAFDIIGGQLKQLTTQQKPHLLTFGLALALWSASRGVDALRGALNLSYDVRETRPFWKTNGISILVTIATAGLVLVSVAAFALGGDVGLWLAEKAHVDSFWAVAWNFARWPFTAMLIMFVAALLYYFLPDVQQEWRFIRPGSVLGTLMWLGATYGFTFYVEHFGSYQKTYGSIGGVIVLLTWLWITGLIFIVGGEINALVEHTSRDGKAKGARAEGETPPPVEERPSAAPPGALKTEEVKPAAVSEDQPGA